MNYLPFLLLCMLIGVVLTAGCVESMDPEQELPIFPQETAVPVPTQSSFFTAASMQLPSDVGGGYYISPQALSVLFTDVSPVQYTSGLLYKPKIQKKILYYEHFNITSEYTHNNRILNVTVPYAPVILEFTFDGGQKTETGVKAEFQTKTFTEYVMVDGFIQEVQTEYYVTDGGKYTEMPDHTVSHTTIPADVWFRVGIIKNFATTDACREEVKEFGSSADDRRIGSTSLLILEDGFARGYSFETKKTLKILAPGNYTIHMTGTGIKVSLRALALVPPDWDGTTTPEELQEIYREIQPPVPVVYAEEEEEWY